MKPQCTTPAQCLKELARVMDKFGIADIFEAIDSRYVKKGQKRSAFPEFYYPQQWQFAIAEVEGKPVFLYDSLYDSGGVKWHVTSHNDGFLYADMSNGMTRELDPQFLSWNPPKPATMMVEMPYSAVEYMARVYNNSINTGDVFIVGNACKKALEELK